MGDQSRYGRGAVRTPGIHAVAEWADGAAAGRARQCPGDSENLAVTEGVWSPDGFVVVGGELPPPPKKKTDQRPACPRRGPRCCDKLREGARRQYRAVFYTFDR